MRHHLIGLLFFILCVAGTHVRATHIVGAELIYNCVNSQTNTYNLELILYRDCENGQADYDASIQIFIFDSVGNFVQVATSLVPNNTPQLIPNGLSACVASPPNICVEEGVYRTTVTLPPITGGYNIAWARCCRNQAITNLFNPLGQGITFLARIPGTGVAQCNSMPQFDQVPPIFLCVDQQFTFDHSATDPDGDSLVYALTNPYTGLNTQGLGAGNPMQGGNPPTVTQFNNPMGPPPYSTVSFQTGYSFTDPFGSNDFTIDPLTGFISVTPNQTGIFVFSISVFEYRNGAFISENRRDFQITVIQCLTQGQPPAINHDLTGLNTNGDTIIVGGGVPFCYDLTLQDPITSDVVNAFPVSAVFGTGAFFPPAATFTFTQPTTNTIQGQVCWEPSCDYSGQTIPIIVGGRDLGDCQNFSDVFDTVWVRILDPVNTPPVITPDYTGLNVSGDTIIVDAEDQLCYDITVNDPDIQDSLFAAGITALFTSGNATFTQTGTNPITGQVCWTPGCDDEGQTFPMVIQASDFAPCKNGTNVQTTIFVRVEAPDNDPPQLSSDLTGNVFSDDTVFVLVEDPFCFDYTSTDPNTGDTLSFTPISSIFTDPGGPTVTSNGVNPLSGQICWTPSCDFENQVVELIFQVEDQGQCSNLGLAFDTVYISVQSVPNDPPVITSDLTGSGTFNGDTIVVDALDGFCYTFTATDVNGGDVLTAFAQSPIFNQPDGPSFTSSGSNPVTGQICWTPSCDFVGQVVELVIGTNDDASCSAQGDDFDTVYVQINLPPNDPPTATTDLTGLTTDGDTIFVGAEEPFCYTVTFDDINLQDTLSGFTVSPEFSGPDSATFIVTGVNPLTAQICWTPDCDNEGQVIPLIVGARDNGDCNNIKEVLDTVYIKVSDPQTVAPIVDHDLSGVPNVVNDTIILEIGEGACYSFYIADQTTDGGVDFEFEFENQFGLNLPITAFNIIERNDSILGEVCFDADCSNGGTTYRSIVTGLDEEVCPPFKTSSDTIFIKVNTDFRSFAGQDTFFCEGTGGVQLNVTPIGGAAPYFYQWFCDDPSGCGFSPNGNQVNPTVNPTDTTIYSVQVTDNNGCTSEIDNIQVNVNKLPIVDAGPDTFRCAGAPGIRLQGNVINPLQAPGPYTYSWDPDVSLNDPTTVDPFATPDTTTIYTLIVGSSNGCSSFTTTVNPLSTITVEVRPRPDVEAGPDIDLCLGDTANLSGFATGAGPGYDYFWTPATGLNDSSDQQTAVSPSATTTYFFISRSNGCRSVADSVTVTVHTVPTVLPSSVYDICALDSVELKAIAGGDLQTDEFSYQWSPAVGLDNPTSATPMASPDTTTNYTIVATSRFGCGSKDVVVPVQVRPTPTIELANDTTICEGDTIALVNNFRVLGDNPTQPTFFTWTPIQNLSSPLVREPLAYPDENTLYIVETRIGACASVDSIFIDVTPAVVLTVEADTTRSCSADSVQLFAVGPDPLNATYQWFPTEGLSDPTIPNPMASPDTTTTYAVRVTQVGCDANEGIEIDVIPSPVVDFFHTVSVGCPDVTVSFVENTENALFYIWDLGDGTPVTNVPNPTRTYSDPGVYTVSLTAVGEAGCETVVSRPIVEVFAPGQASFVTDPDRETPLILPGAEVNFSNTSTGAVEYYWEFGDGGVSTAENPKHTYQSPGNYLVKLITRDAGGCIDEYTYGPITVIEPDVDIPNVFTPNGDGYNDAFRVTYNGESTFRMDIVDRWGRTLAEGITNPTTGWDGRTAEGDEASAGVYYYVIYIGDRLYKGDLTLLR